MVVLVVILIWLTFWTFSSVLQSHLVASSRGSAQTLNERSVEEHEEQQRHSVVDERVEHVHVHRLQPIGKHERLVVMEVLAPTAGVHVQSAAVDEEARQVERQR